MRKIALILFGCLVFAGCNGGGGGSGGGGGDGDGDAPQPDLHDSGSALEQLIPSPTVQWGDHFQALCMVGNNSEEPAGSFQVALYASADSTITGMDHYLGIQTVASLGAWGSQTVLFDIASFPNTVPAGDYYIGYLIDTGHSVDESDESNNVGRCTNGILTVAGASVTQLTNGIPVNDSVAYHAWKYYSVVVPEGATELVVATSGATADVDLYVRRGSLPGLTAYDFRPYTGSGNETVTVNAGTVPALSAATWYIGVYGYTAASYTVTAQVSTGLTPQLVVSDGFEPHLSPDGTKIVFTRLSAAPDDSYTDIWRVNVDGTGLTQLTYTLGESEFSPQWNPTGTRITFLRKSGTIGSTVEGWLFDIATNGTNLTLRSNAPMEDFCHYTADGGAWTEILAIRTDGRMWLSMGWPSIGGWALRRSGSAHNVRSSADPSLTGASPYVTMNDSTARKIVKFNPINLSEETIQAGYDFPDPCPSPSGTKIAAGTDGGLPWGLYTMNADGSGLTTKTTSTDLQPTWHGDTIVFVRVPGGGTLRHGNIYKLTGMLEGAHPAAEALYVPSSEYESIQSAIDAAVGCQKVVVAPGEYWENLDYHGKEVTVESSDGPEVTVLRPLDEGLATVAFTSGEGQGAKLRGFTVMGGESGILVRGADPDLSGSVMQCGVDSDGFLPGLLGNPRQPTMEALASWLMAEPREFLAELRREHVKAASPSAQAGERAAGAQGARGSAGGAGAWGALSAAIGITILLVLLAEWLRRKRRVRKHSAG